MATPNALPLCLFLISGWTFGMHERMPVAEVLLNGKGPYRFLVDTGATSCAMRPQLAAALGLAADYRVEIVTVAGRTLAPATRKVHVQTGGIQLLDVELVWSDLHAAPGIVGVLGQSFLQRFDYLINADGLHFGVQARQLAAKLPAAPIPFQLSEGRILIPAYTSAHDHLNLIVDSGAGLPILFRMPTQFTSATLTTANGSIGAALVNLPMLRVGRHWLHQVPAALVPSATNARHEDGLLPTSLFRAVFVDNQRRLITLQR